MSGVMEPDLPRRVAAELLGTAFLLAAIVGSGAMAESLTDDVGLQLLQNAVATAAVLTALIVTFGAISGAHLNPAVTLANRLLGRVDTATAAAYVASQTVGAVLGVMVANVMFERAPVEWSTTDRAGAALATAEGVATLGLLLVIFCTAHAHRIPVVAVAVGAYIAGAFAFTSSTSFANPAVTLGRILTDSFAGIAPSSAPAFVAAQLLATVAAVGLITVLLPARPARVPRQPAPGPGTTARTA